MGSTSVNRYRVKKHHTVDSSGNVNIKYHAQYKSILFGWRYMYKYYWSNSNHVDEGWFIGGYGCSVLAIILLLTGFFIISTLLFVGGYLLLYLGYRSLSSDAQGEENLERSKRFIEKRIQHLKIKKRKKKKIDNSNKEIPDDEVYYLNLQVERSEKLKKLKKKSIFRW